MGLIQQRFTFLQAQLIIRPKKIKLPFCTLHFHTNKSEMTIKSFQYYNNYT
jgi:hypothetical protein